MGTFIFFYGLTKAQPFLAPLLTAFVLALLIIPMAKKLEKWGLKSIFASLISFLALIVVFLGVSFVVSLQIKDVLEDWEELKESFMPKLKEFEGFILDHTPMEKESLEEYKNDYGMSEEEDGDGENEEEEDNGNEEDKGEQALQIMGGTITFLTNFLITLVYVFLFMHFRQHFKTFILLLFPKRKQEEVSVILGKSSTVVQTYLLGRLFLMVILVILYSIGLLISGVENWLFVSVIAAILSIIPFVGNFLGYLIAMAMGLFSGGDTGILLGVTITFLFVQFLDSYILQPMVLGGKLDVHPFFIIFSVILGNEIWGIIGMVLAIPLFAIVSILCRNIPQLDAFGYLFSNDNETFEEKRRKNAEEKP